MTDGGQKHVAVVLKTNVGGLWLMPQIRAIRHRGHRVTVVIPPGPGRLREMLDAEGFTVRESPFSFSYAISPATIIGLLRLRHLLARLRPDVVFYHLYASALAARFCTLGLRVRRVHMVAGPLYLEVPLIAAAERFACRLDSTLIAGSAYTARRYLELGVLNRPALVTIPYGTDTAKNKVVSNDERRAARARLGIADDEFVAIMVAYFYAPKDHLHGGMGIKGHEVLFAAWSRFVSEHRSARLLVVGNAFDERSEGYRDRLYEQHGDLDGVHWMGFTPQVRDFYAASDVSVSPSLSENHGAAVEASAFGIPSIVSDAGGLPEVIDEQCGWVVPAGDTAALHAALGSAAEAFRANELAPLGQGARAKVETCFDAVAAAESVVETILDERSPRPVLVVTEARYGIDDCGRWTAGDAVNGDTQWTRYAALSGQMSVAGRVESARTAGDPLTVARLRLLPAYRGMTGLAVRALPLLYALWGGVRSARLLVLRVPGPLSFLAGAMAVLLRRPYAVEVVGDPLDVLTSLYRGRAGRGAAHASATVMRLLVRRARAARYVTVRSLQERYPGRPGTQVRAIADGVLRPEDFVASPRDRAPLDRPVHLLAIGSQANRYKGHHVAIRAMSLIRDSHPDAHLTLLGDGPEQENLRALARELGLSRAVTFAGHVRSRNALRAHLDGATALLHPSLTEGLPRAVLEAQARAVPVIGTRVGGIPELVDEKWLVDVSDAASLAAAVTRLTSESEIYREASRSALQRAGMFRQDVTDGQFAEWSGVLAALAGARAPRRRGSRSLQKLSALHVYRRVTAGRPALPAQGPAAANVDA